MSVKDKIWDVLPRLKKIREEKERLRQQRASLARIEDLFKVMHRVGDVELPIPNLFAKTMLEKHFGGIDHIDINDPEHLAAVVWYLKNQQRVEIASLPLEQIQEEIHRLMVEMPLSHVQQYQRCIIEIFDALQKKTLVDEQKILEEALRILDGGKP